MGPVLLGHATIACQAMDQRVLMPGDPTTVRKMRHDTAVQATGCAQVQIFATGILAQGGELEARDTP